MKSYFFAFIFVLFSFLCLNAAYLDIEVPELKLSGSVDHVTPSIEGYELDGTGENFVLPYRRLYFSSKVTRIEVLAREEIVLPAPLKKGAPLYRIYDMKPVVPASEKESRIPTPDNFTFDHATGSKRGKKLFSFNFYPVFPSGENKITKLKKVRFHFEKHDPEPLRGLGSGRSMLILTNRDFVENSTQLENYIALKRSLGFNVDVATEDSYGGGNLQAVERFKKIREYLKGVCKNYDFLLIIANPDPSGKDVPMLVVRPGDAEEPGYELVPTDIFYAELSEDIDSSENGIYGEHIDSISFDFEWVVGRIPLYGSNPENPDRILKRTIDFIKEDPSKAENRRRFFFPTTISYYEKQDGIFNMPKMDGAYVIEFLENNALVDPFVFKTLVESEGLAPSEFTDNDSISYDAVLRNWNVGNGLVFWIGHGEPTYSVRTIWERDLNGNGYPDTYQDLDYSKTFVDVAMTKRMESEVPFVFQGSCLNGTIESPGSLAYSVLLNTAVGVVGASQVSYGAIFPGYDLSSNDIFSYGVSFTAALINDKIPAVDLFAKKEAWSSYDVLLTVKYETNYLGDPSLKLGVVECGSDSDCDDGLFCTGTESCVDGFCRSNFDALVCENGDDPCIDMRCDEASKSCQPGNATDGIICGRPDDMCYEAQVCLNGVCTPIGAKDCSSLDSFCSEGVCNPQNGLCEKQPLNEGIACETGKLCLVDGVCREGSCQGTSPEMPEPKACSRVECNEIQGVVNVGDASLNWSSCETADGYDGYCDYGTCVRKKSQKKSGSSSGGCSLLLF
ncbi:hypothetical protein IKR20_03825 [bacterium]|nr:hypothetical protein [bacterium]